MKFIEFISVDGKFFSIDPYQVSAVEELVGSSSDETHIHLKGESSVLQTMEPYHSVIHRIKEGWKV